MARPPVSPRTSNQLAYLQSLSKQRRCFRCGASRNRKNLSGHGVCSRSAEEQADQSNCVNPAGRRSRGSIGVFTRRPGGESACLICARFMTPSTTCSTPTEAQKFAEKNLIEIAPLAYMRGRTLNRACVILDEAQNATREQMFMFLDKTGRTITSAS